MVLILAAIPMFFFQPWHLPTHTAEEVLTFVFCVSPDITNRKREALTPLFSGNHIRESFFWFCLNFRLPYNFHKYFLPFLWFPLLNIPFTFLNDNIFRWSPIFMIHYPLLSSLCRTEEEGDAMEIDGKIKPFLRTFHLLSARVHIGVHLSWSLAPCTILLHLSTWYFGNTIYTNKKKTSGKRPASSKLTASFPLGSIRL